MYLLPGLRIVGGIPLLRHMSEWHEVGQLKPSPVIVTLIVEKKVLTFGHVECMTEMRHFIHFCCNTFGAGIL